ncbi:unnamed protein product [Prunus armeniaca]
MIPASSVEADLEDQTLADRLRQLNADLLGRQRSVRLQAEVFLLRGPPPKRPFTVDLDAEPAPKRGRQTELPRAIFAADNDDELADPVTLACPSNMVQFANHMILGSQMELSEIEDLPKKLLRKEAGRTFRLQASVSSKASMDISIVSQASMDMWLCVKRAINAAEKAKKAYEDGRARVMRTW